MIEAPAGYELLEPVGEGGSGAVYRARHVGGGDVALKVLRPELALDSSSAARFRREARVATGLHHPHLARCLEGGTLPGGRPFLAYEWLDGETLEARLGRAPSPTVREAMEWMQGILDGVAAAHERGWLHRDLKPANVLRTRDGRVKVIDFGLATGLARAVDAETFTRLTRSGTILGTPAYMAPEQVEGLPVDARTDVWAAGVILFRLVTGSLPFEARTPTLTLLKVVSERAPKLVGRADLHPALAAAVDRALEVDPAGRFDDAASFVEALRSVPRDERVLPGPLLAAVDVTRTIER